MSETKRDVFICHASEDKEDVVRPLVEACERAGISCWYDEAEIGWGDSISDKVNHGLAISRFVIVVFSQAFAGKNWPRRELNSAINREASTGEVIVLPLVVGNTRGQQEILSQFPLLNDKRFLPWDGDHKAIVSALLSRFGRHAPTAKSSSCPVHDIPIPKIKKEFSQRDKDLFLRDAFKVIKGYFQTALKETEQRYDEVETDFNEVHRLKFIATIYLSGEVASQCKIWQGGLSSSNSIGYQAGKVRIDNDNSFNDILEVSANTERLGFQRSMMRAITQAYADKNILTAEEAAEYLWKQFTEKLGQGGSL